MKPCIAPTLSPVDDSTSQTQALNPRPQRQRAPVAHAALALYPARATGRLRLRLPPPSPSPPREDILPDCVREMVRRARLRSAVVLSRTFVEDGKMERGREKVRERMWKLDREGFCIGRPQP